MRHERHDLGVPLPEAHDGRKQRVDRAHRGFAVFALAAEAVSIACSLIVVAILREGLDRNRSEHDALLSQVNPWYIASIWTMLAAMAALVLWGILGLRRRPVGHRIAAWGVVGGLLAFAGVAWALSLYTQLD